MVHHLDDGAHPRARLAERDRVGAVVFDLGGGVGPIAELVLEAHQVDGVARAVGRPARHQEAGEAARRLGEITPAGMVAQIDLTITDEHPQAQAIVIISAIPRTEPVPGEP